MEKYNFCRNSKGVLNINVGGMQQSRGCCENGDSHVHYYVRLRNALRKKSINNFLWSERVNTEKKSWVLVLFITVSVRVWARESLLGDYPWQLSQFQVRKKDWKLKMQVGKSKDFFSSVSKMQRPFLRTGWTNRRRNLDLKGCG